MTGWRDAAACLGRDPQWWFPGAGESPARAKRVCAGCPVDVECLAEAMRIEGVSRWGRHGIWGGLTPQERERLARKSRRRSNGDNK